MGFLEPLAAGHSVSHTAQIHAADVISLLREVYADGIGTPEEAEELIAFDQSLTEPSPGWSEFFAAAIADHVVRRQVPAGKVDDRKAAWLIDLITRGRHVATASSFAAVLNVIETAEDVSPRLAAHAIRQLRSKIFAGKELAGGVHLDLRRIVDFESSVLVRRILTGPAGQSSKAVSREEAEALFDLHDLAAGGANDADFDDLFFKAVAHYLIANAGGRVPPRQEALSRQTSFPSGVKKALNADETAWLASHIMRDGRPTRAELALLQQFAGGTDDTDTTVSQSQIRAA